MGFVDNVNIVAANIANSIGENIGVLSLNRATIADMIAIPNPSTDLTCIVTDKNQGGTFVYDSTQSTVNNGGTIFNGWIRQYSGAVNVKWFGAVGDGVTDDTLAIQKAINTVVHLSIPKGNFLITSTINIDNSNTIISGLSKESQILQNSEFNAFHISTTSGLVEFVEIKNLEFWLNTIPSYDASKLRDNAAISIDGLPSDIAAAIQRCKITNIRIVGYGIGIYTSSNVNTLLDRIFIENYADYSSKSGYTNSNLYCGVFLDAQSYSLGGISPQASIILNNVVVNGDGAPSAVVSKCFYVNGNDIRDIFINNCETSGGDYGIHFVATNSYNIDVHINDFICDAVKISGILLENCVHGAISIKGGYIVTTGNSAAIWLTNSSGVNISSMQLLGVGSSSDTCEGIRFFNSKNCSFVNNIVGYMAYGISIQNSLFITISSNIINNEVCSLKSTIVAHDAIRIFSSSSNCSIVGNTISGDANTKYANGINDAAGNTELIVSANTVDTTTVTTPYNINSNSTVLTNSSLASRYLSLTATGSPIKIQGNDATSPIEFLDGGGITIGYFKNNGLYTPNLFTQLPTSDPKVIGQLWNNAGVVTVSAG